VEQDRFPVSGISFVILVFVVCRLICHKSFLRKLRKERTRAITILLLVDINPKLDVASQNI